MCCGSENLASGASAQGAGLTGGQSGPTLYPIRATDSDIGLVTGAFFQDHPLVAYSSQGAARAIDLQYNSLQADTRPIIQVALTTILGSHSGSVVSLTAHLFIDNVSQGPAATYTATSLGDGNTYLVALQGNATALATGVHGVRVEIVKTFSDGYTYPESFSDSVNVVNASASPYGAGWSIGGLQAIAGDPGSLLITAGSQGTEKYTLSASGQYVGPPGDTSTLVQNSGGTWTRTYPDGTVLQYDAAGRETSEADRNGNTTSYAYVAGGAAAGALSTITDPVGRVTTLAYDSSGKLATVTDPAGRVTTVTVDSSGNLTGITDPDSASVAYGYSTPSNHRITTEVSPNASTATVTYDSFGRTQSEALFGATGTTGVAVAQEEGLLAAGATGPLLQKAKPDGTVTDPNGRTASFTFESMYHPIDQRDGAGASSYEVLDSQHGWPTSVTDPLSRTTTYSYDSSGNVTGVTRFDATSMAIVYGVDSQPAQVTDYRHLITTFTLDPSDGNVTRRTDPDGLHEDWTYNSAGQVLTDTDRNGHTTSYAYDSYGQLTTITYPGAGSPQVRIAYDSAGDPTRVTDELGHATTYTYDLAGRVLSMQDPVQAAAGEATSYAYDADGNLTSVTDALNHVTSYAYDARDRLTTMTDAANQGTGHATVYGYDGMNLTSVTDPDGHPTTYSYDGDNRRTGMTDALDHRTTWAYDGAGQLGTATDSDGHTTTYTYDPVGRLQTETRPGTADNGSGTLIPVLTTYTYNDDDQVTSVTDALNHTTTYGYDDLGRQVSATDALNHTTSYGYDAAGNRTAVTDALGHVTGSAYDARNRLVSQTEPSGGGTTTYSYDDASRLTSVTDPVNNVTSYGYDDANRETTETDPRGKVTTYAYDLAGNVTRKTDRDGRVTSYVHDADNRGTVEQWIPAGGGSPTYSMTITYDSAGRETSVVDNNSHYAYGYDDANRLITVNDQGTAGLPQVTMTYGFDDVGNRTSLADTEGGVVSYTYDVRDELTTLTQSGTSAAAERVDLAYDAGGRMTTLTRFSDTAGTAVVARTLDAYDAANRLTTIAHQASGGSTISSYAYTLDAANRLTAETRTWTTPSGTASDTLAYGYTSNDQLTSVTHTNTSFANESFGYDANGNRDTTGYSTGTGNRLSGDGTYNYAYDDEGNLTSKTAIATGIETTYAYDYRNRLTGVQQVSGGVTTTLAQYTYDALDRRIGESINPPASAPSVGDAGFESPSVGTGSSAYVGGPTGTPWTYSGSAGVAGNGSAFTSGNPDAPEGTQVAFIQDASSISQAISGWAAGSYTISFRAAQRGNFGGANDFEVVVDTTVVGTFTPSGTSYASYSTPSFAVAAGSHTIKFIGLNSLGGDDTSFIDSVAVAPVPVQRWTLYDGQTPLLDFDGSGAVTARYLSVPGAIDEVLARQTSAGVAWYLDDREGTVRDLVDNSGAVIDHVDYGAFGAVTGETAPAAGDRFKYAGMEYNSAIALYYDRARWYDADAGRFIREDHIGFAGGDANLYRYAGNGPTNGVDPTGEAFVLPPLFPKTPNTGIPGERTKGSGPDLDGWWSDILYPTPGNEPAPEDCKDLLKYFNYMRALYIGRIADYQNTDPAERNLNHHVRIEKEYLYLLKMMELINKNCSPPAGVMQLPRPPKRPISGAGSSSDGSSGGSPASGRVPLPPPPPNPFDPAEPGFILPRIGPPSRPPIYNPQDPRQVPPPPTGYPQGPIRILQPIPAGPIRVAS
jgi:RHS repeat-associated protein